MSTSHWSRWGTIAAVLLLALIAAVVSYSHMYALALRHGEPEWRGALFPLSVDGMIVASSMTLLSDARNGRKGGVLPWALLIVGSGASLAANVAVADPTMWSRIIHAWPSFALIGAYELLMRAFRTAARSVRRADAERTHTEELDRTQREGSKPSSMESQEFTYLHVVKTEETAEAVSNEVGTVEEGQVPPKVQQDAWEWALENRQPDGSLPTGEQIAARFGRKPRWGRLIKQGDNCAPWRAVKNRRLLRWRPCLRFRSELGNGRWTGNVRQGRCQRVRRSLSASAARTAGADW